MQFEHNHHSVIQALDNIVSAVQLSFNQCQSDVYWLSVDFRMLIAATGVKHTEAHKAAVYIVDSLVEQLKPNESLLISSFYFSFPHSKAFSPYKSEVQTGVFGAMLLAQYPQHRVQQPFYSFLVFGHAYPSLTQNYIAKSTGPDSIFEWVINNNTQLICVGHHYVKSLSSIHHAEHCADVDYRYVKTFSGSLLLQNSKEQHIETQFYVRDLDTCDFSSLTNTGDRAFREAAVIESQLLSTLKRPLLIHSINLLCAHEMMLQDLNSGNNRYVDYYGPMKQEHEVITGKVADKLYTKELNALINTQSC
ncbi:hypothetical protein GSF04_17935 [Pseudoalteromonas sp. A22]|uniref:AAC(3) family N-acetyltransferase n=1 Tax=Pseudoalteromonas TaxID=53246 RepID=UPI001BAA6A97|nr:MULTISPECIES: AAC(3) family N-acetyltransferase [Pseudoalteromonas]QUI64261.1 hypothetical protein GSF04_17935 [Pseudoalteromonas sp. A22]USE69970.1 hypothetical protein CTT31_12885 [Pseudoalteromonas flavipulchra]